MSRSVSSRTTSRTTSGIMRLMAPVVFVLAVLLFVVVLWRAQSSNHVAPEASQAAIASTQRPEIVAGSVKKVSKMDEQLYQAVLREDGLVEFYLITDPAEEAELVSEVPVDVAKTIAAHYSALSAQPMSSRVEMYTDDSGAFWTRSQMKTSIPVLVLWFLAFISLAAVASIVHLQYRAYRREKIQAALTRGQYQARETERARLAAELHDGPIQEMQYLIRSHFGRSSREKDDVVDRDTVRSVLESVSAGLRQVCTELRPPTLHHFGLGMAVQALVSTFESRNPYVEVDVEVTGDNMALPENTVIVFYRILQEALNNVAKHAGPCDVVIRLDVDDYWAELSVEDNGLGCDLPKLDHLIRDGHFGLSGIVERANTVGAAVEVRSNKDEGTLVRAVVRRPEPTRPGVSKEALRAEE